MRNANETIVREAGAGAVVDVLGHPVTYKASHAETGGRFCLFEQEIPPGYAVPLHRHAVEDEAMYVLEGEIAIDGEAGAHRVGPGGFVYLPHGRFHTFRNDGPTPARAIVICTPGDQLEPFFQRLAAASRAGTPSPEAMTALAAGYGIELAPPAS